MDEQVQLFHGSSADFYEMDAYEKLNQCITKIGFGRYQWKLFALCGFGWAADNMWFQGLAVILPQVKLEFRLESWMIGIGTTSTHMGAMVGAIFWGYTSDIIGRQPAFLMTLILTTIGGFCSAFAPNLIVLCLSLALMGIGIGGNLPIDGALFLEFTPQKNQSLLTLMSLFWPLGQVLTAVVAWLLIPISSCSNAIDCDYKSNMGWRYVLFTLSIITLSMVILRVTLLSFLESPKNLIARNKYSEAVDVLHKLAKMNHVELDINEDDFKNQVETTTKVGDYSMLLKNGMATTTVFITVIWVLIAVGYTMFNAFLPEFLKTAGVNNVVSTNEVYRDFVVISAFGIPGSILGMYMSETVLGRRGTMAIATFGTALSLFLFTVFQSPWGQLVSSCLVSFLQNIMYGVLYTYTPEVFPTYMRGKAVGLASAAGRLTGSFAPIITGYLIFFNIHYPLWTSACLILLSGCIMIFLPIETRGIAAR